MTSKPRPAGFCSKASFISIQPITTAHLSILIGLIILYGIVGCSTPPAKPEPPAKPTTSQQESSLTQLASKYGNDARSRVETWQRLIEENQNISEIDKLNLTNQFINQLDFVDDLTHWGKRDYWATPIETLASNGGDCEDFSIAKYVTLTKLGVPDACLRLVYVKADLINQSHMVLTHQCSPKEPVLVLDNLIPEILPAEKRTDLHPVYSFNASDLWVNKQLNNAKQTGSSQQIGLWQQLLEKMQQEDERFGQ